MKKEKNVNYENYILQIELCEFEIQDVLCENFDAWVDNVHTYIQDEDSVDNWVTKIDYNEFDNIMEEIINYFEELGARSDENYLKITLTNDFFENYEKNLLEQHYKPLSKLKTYSVSLEEKRSDMTLESFILDVLLPNKKEYENKVFVLETIMHFN